MFSTVMALPGGSALDIGALDISALGHRRAGTRTPSLAGNDRDPSGDSRTDMVTQPTGSAPPQLPAKGTDGTPATLKPVRFLRGKGSPADAETRADAGVEVSSAAADEPGIPTGGRTAGKGRPTPSRREAEGRRRGPAPPPPRTPREAVRRMRS